MTSRGYSLASADQIARKMNGLLGNITRGVLPSRPGRLQDEGDAPDKVGNGPDSASTCTDLEGPLPLHIWDVNCYYRDLRVPTNATRKQLMRAYQRFGNNPNARLTYVFKQLLNPVVRREYDMMPLGSVYIDQFVHDAVHRAVQREMARRRLRQSQEQMDDPQDVNYEDVLVDMGFRIVPDEDEVDNAEDEGLTASAPRWGYSFYLWKSNEREDTARLAMWQEHVVAALARKGVRTRIAVGYCGRMAHPYVVGVVGNLPIVFLNDREQPEPLLADRAADRVVEAQAQIVLRG